MLDGGGSLFLITIFAIISSGATAASNSDSLKIYWNSPSGACFNNGTIINTEKYGIITNKGQAFRGNKIVVLYEKEIGLYPAIKKYDNGSIEWVNGGIPQNVNMKHHLKVLRQQIKIHIPDPNFSGPAVLDIEEWRPFFDQNWSGKQVYKKASIKKVLAERPLLTEAEATVIAEEEFNKASLHFIHKTLNHCKKMRPKASWGFYGWPLCDINGYKRNFRSCYQRHNRKLLKILRNVDAFYPSTYLYKNRPIDRQKRYVREILSETERLNYIIQKEGYGRKKVFVFTEFEINPYEDDVSEIRFYNKMELDISIRQDFQFEVDGILLWSTSKNMLKRCSSIATYVDEFLGPYILNLRNFYNHHLFLNIN
uniref:Hyaluronidase n=1 Tax=Rhabditophanes sp. KR3021 TaxID=114890 RepID=A0AC35TN28_9BILA